MVGMRAHGGGDVPLDSDVIRGDGVIGCHHKYLGISEQCYTLGLKPEESSGFHVPKPGI